MALEMESMASAIGVSVPVLRFLLCFVATIPVSFTHRFVQSPFGKHLYAALSGAFLSYLSFGFSSNLLFLVPMLLGYLSMVLFRPYCGFLTFLLGFGYLIGWLNVTQEKTFEFGNYFVCEEKKGFNVQVEIRIYFLLEKKFYRENAEFDLQCAPVCCVCGICHVYYMSGDAWKEGGIDATGALMVLTLKVISCAMSYNDGLLKEEELREAQKKNRLIELPSFIEYVGFCLCCGSHFAGPVFEMKDYLEWTERKGIWAPTEKGPAPSPFGATIQALLQATVCMALYLYLIPHFNISGLNGPAYQEWGFWKRLSYQYMSGFTARWKYYFIWSISEAAVIISGLGFSGWTDTSPSKPKWDRAKNVDVLGVEFAKSSVQLPLVWNIQVSTWLRHYVYDRLVQKGKKPGFFQLLATQTTSAVWHLSCTALLLYTVVANRKDNLIFSYYSIFNFASHCKLKRTVKTPKGLYPGYIIFFVQSALMIAGSRVLYRWQQAIPSNMNVVKNLLVFISFAYTVLVLNYSAVGFMVLTLQETLALYGSVYYIGTIAPIVLILLGNMIKPAKPSRSKARKEQ
ncbi:lysophospholipid acyltransferase 1-like [Populus alba x Populus x berolinensis]|uniref:Lysophospholipid acyltransferase 1-like n=1 Tax=Populus alba x Populus x berolinensis TaxID=444605 RepID=A0AAD6RKK8_9ROSI|nr:lysophospholipid acyltransferase 1-like [Populus alba x Populus x berolinensis]